jgi:hypothetical protein
MLKKRIPTPQQNRQQQARPDTQRPTSVKPPVEPDDDDEEEAPPTPKASAKPKEANVGGGNRKGGKSLAQAFDDVPMSNNADNLPPGKYEAIIKDVVMQAKDAKGQSVRMHFELCSPNLAEANSITTWFKIADADEQIVGGGIRALKQTLAKLGYEATFDDLEECFEQITEEKPGVLLKISYSKDAQGNEWQRAVVEDLCDNDIVAAYKDNVPY